METRKVFNVVLRYSPENGFPKTGATVFRL